MPMSQKKSPFEENPAKHVKKMQSNIQTIASMWENVFYINETK